jgi:hypothetical protein
MRVVTYWAARLGIFLAIAAILWWAVKWQDLISLLAAFILGWLVSYLVLPGMRRDAAAQMDAWMTRSEKSIREADAEEDAEIGGAFTSRSEGDEPGNRTGQRG